MKSLGKTLSTATGIVIAAGVAMSAATAEVPGVTDAEIKIGSFGPLTGPVYIYGKLSMNGVAAVFDKVNEAGGVHGRKLKLVREDDLCKPEGAIAAVKKLVYDHKVFAINGGACSNATLAAKPEIVKSGVPFVVFAAVADGISSPPTKNIFTTQLTASIESRAQLQWALDKGAKKIAIVAQHDAWGRSRYEPMIKAFKAKGLKPVADEEMTVDINDGTAQALRVMNSGADAVLAVLYPKPAAVMIRDSLKLGYKPEFVGQTAIQDLLALQEQVGIKGALQKFVSITTVPSDPKDPKDPKVAEWRDRVKKLFPNDELSVFNLVGIGSANVVVEALKRSGPDLTRDKFLAALGTIKNFDNGIYPGPIDCNPPKSNQCNQSPAFIKLEGGKVVYAGTAAAN